MLGITIEIFPVTLENIIEEKIPFIIRAKIHIITRNKLKESIKTV